LSQFPLPAGGTVVQEVGPGNDDCVHDVVVPFPGGFSMPAFCIPALGFSVGQAQIGCGVGRVDSNGGSDYTVSELGDTSDSSDACAVPHASCGDGGDGTLRVDVTVGDATPDVCSAGMANAIVSVPIHTWMWIEHSSGDSCPANDGTFDPGDDPVQDDFLIGGFVQVLDLTTDTAAASWTDIDGDGCSVAGRGPAVGFSRTGVCLDLAAGTVTSVAAGLVGSSGPPLFDITFSASFPSTFVGPNPPLEATCPAPPPIHFAGVTTRCLLE
jgi:hypothetical protein